VVPLMQHAASTGLESVFRSVVALVKAAGPLQVDLAYGEEK
jgi:hypothetical protein